MPGDIGKARVYSVRDTKRKGTGGPASAGPFVLEETG